MNLVFFGRQRTLDYVRKTGHSNDSGKTESSGKREIPKFVGKQKNLGKQHFLKKGDIIFLGKLKVQGHGAFKK